jgi:hypothetical protein
VIMLRSAATVRPFGDGFSLVRATRVSGDFQLFAQCDHPDVGFEIALPEAMRHAKIRKIVFHSHMKPVERQSM